MKLSIITVNLNNHDGLQKTIDSVVSQTFKDFEWIVIDGGSTDGSRELIEQYADHFAYWVSEPDKGIYNAMNKGIKVAKGEYLQFLNSGDWLWEDDILERVFDANPSEDFVYGNYIQKNGVIANPPAKIDLLFLYRSTISHQAIFIRNRTFSASLYDESYRIASDWKHLLFNIAFGSASYRKMDVTFIGEQEGCSYDTSLTQKEREEILNKAFGPFLRATLDDYAQYVDNPMRPYYNYMQQFPKLEKQIRRIVRLHKKVFNK